MEIPVLTSATTRVWAQPDGSETAEISAGPVRLQRDGRWLDYDFTLERRADGTVAPKVHPHDLVISGKAGAGEHDLATLSAGGERLGFGWSGVLPEPVLEGAKATYPEVAAGIDLVVEAQPTGFEQFFIVKDRAAAARVAGLRALLKTGATSFVAKSDGSGEFRGARGGVVARMPVALMWDAQGLGARGERKREAKVAVDVAEVKAGGRTVGRDVRLAPDLAWLNDPATRYPVVVDPGIEVDHGVGFDEFVQNTINLSDNQSKTELKVGYTNDGCQCYARSYLRFDGLTAFGGAKIHSAQLNLWQTWSHNCTATTWKAARTDHVAGWVQWNNEPAHLEAAGSSTDSKGWSSNCAAGWVDVDVAAAIDDTLSARGDWASIVIMSDNWNIGSWKKFSSAEGGMTPHIKLSYNRVPWVSDVKAQGDPTCRTGAGMRLYLNTLTPTFSAYVGDEDAQNVRLQVEITPLGGSARPLVESTVGARNSFLEVTVPGGQALAVNTVYTYRARAVDLAPDASVVDVSGWSPPCEIQYDATSLDNAPVIEGVPMVDANGDGELWPVLNFGRSTPVMLRPGAGDGGEVLRYSYGFSPDRVGDSSVSVPAGPDGSATVMVTPWEVDGGNVPAGDSMLYVRAFAANGSIASSKLASMQVFFDTTGMVDGNGQLLAQPRSKDDVNGDATADLSGFRDLGNGKAMFYQYSGRADGSLLEPMSLMTTNSYTDADTKVVRGDFNGDGKLDFAAFKNVGPSSTTVSLLRSTGNIPTGDMLADTQVKTLPYALTSIKPVAGDVNADGKDDLVFGQAIDSTRWMLKTMLASVDAHGDTNPNNDEVLFADPANWLAADVQSNLANVTLLMGRFDKNPGADIMEVYDHGGCRTGMYLHESQGLTTFAAAHVVWDSINTGGWCSGNARYTVGSYAPGAYGLDGIVATYDIGGCNLALHTFTPKYVFSPPQAPNDTYVFEPHQQHFASSGTQFWCVLPSAALLSMVDLTGDGKEDLIYEYGCCGPHQQRVWMFTATGDSAAGTTFQTRTLKWQGALGPAGTGSVKRDATTRYQLVAKHSGMCLSVTGGSTVEHSGTSQQPCSAFQPSQQYTIDERGAAYARLRPMHDSGKCVNVSGGLGDDGRPIVSSTCNPSGLGSESWSLTYHSGFTSVPGVPQAGDIVIELKSNNTGKCIGIAGTSMAPGTPAIQWTCNGSADQHFYLRPLRQPSFTGDGTADIAWYDASKNGGTIDLLPTRAAGPPGATRTFATGLAAPEWAGAGDFNGDGRTDVAWYDEQDGGKVKVAFSNTTGTSTIVDWISGMGKPDWASTGDFNGDGKADIAWYETRYGMVGMLITNAAATGPLGATTYVSGYGTPDWAGVGDFNGDGNDDIAWYHEWQNGKIHVNFSNSSGGRQSAADWVTGYGKPQWAGVGDTNGDGKADIFWYHSWNGGVLGVIMTNPAGTGPAYAVGYMSGYSTPDWAGVGDFNGDGRADVAWYHEGQNGKINISFSNSSGTRDSTVDWVTGWGDPDWAGVG